MTEYTVYLQTSVSMVVRVEVDDNLDEHEARESAIEKAFDQTASDVCAQCSGWGQKWSLELGEWDVERDAEGVETPPKRTP